MIEDLRNEFSEWYFGVKETNGDRQPLAMQIMYWFENRLDLPHLIGTKEYGGENLKTEIVKLNKIIDTKESERSEWANMCINKQRQIDGMRKDMDMAMARELMMITDFGSISENLTLGNFVEAKKIADENHQSKPPETVVIWAASMVLNKEQNDDKQMFGR